MIERTLPLAPELCATLSAPDPASLLEELATLRLENAALHAQNAVLQARIRDLEARLGQTSSSSLPSAFVRPTSGSGAPESAAIRPQAGRPARPPWGLPSAAAGGAGG